MTIKDAIEQMDLEVENLTKNQLTEIVRQAIQCGDIVRHVYYHPGFDVEAEQSISYLPFREREEHLSEIKRLREQLEVAVGALERLAIKSITASEALKLIVRKHDR